MPAVKSRSNTERTNNDLQAASTSHRLTAISVSGGFLDGAQFDLSEGLNCLIGARGAGKSTVLEFVRYVLDLLPNGNDHRHIRRLIERNLAGGEIRLSFTTKDGDRYVLRRSAGSQATLEAQNGASVDGKSRARLFEAEVFSQNEVENLADSSEAQLTLVDRFAIDEIDGLTTQLGELDRHLQANANQIVPLQQKLSELTEDLGRLPEVEEKLKNLTPTDRNSGEINQVHEWKALRERESQAAANLKGMLSEAARDLMNHEGWINGRISEELDEDLLNGPNSASLVEMQRQLRELGKQVDLGIRRLRDTIAKEQQAFAELASALKASHEQQEKHYRAVLEKDKVAKQQATERAALEKSRTELQAKKRQRKETEEKLTKLNETRADLLARHSDLQDARFHVRKRIVDSINAQVQPTVRVTLLQAGDRSPLQKILEDALKTTGVKHIRMAEKLNQSVPSELALMVRNHDLAGLMQCADVTKEQGQKVLSALNNPDILFALETTILPDVATIELNDGGEYKDLPNLSTGQKCTAVLPIILMESQRPLLVDQPEDNLDNRFIFDGVVAKIREIKQRRQLIFVTHNPNIPVLGDAERVFVLKSDGTTAYLENEGTVDHCKEDILSLLEGGREAFQKRGERYGS